MTSDAASDSEDHVVRAVQFLGEQDGVPEREFKDRVSEVLAASQVVDRGYLAVLAYGPQSGPVVALCLRAEAPSESIVREVGSVFASLFGRDQHLDILFVDEAQEQGLSQVCRPFFMSRP